MSDPSNDVLETSNRHPTHRAWLVAEVDGKPHWQEVTALWPTKSGKGTTAILKAPVILTGRIVIFPAWMQPGHDEARKADAS